MVKKQVVTTSMNVLQDGARASFVWEGHRKYPEKPTWSSRWHL